MSAELRHRASIADIALRCALGALLLLAAGAAGAASHEGDAASALTDLAPPGVAAQESTSALRGRIEALENASDVTETVKQEAVRDLRTAIAHLESAERFEAAASEFRESLETGPVLLLDLEREVTALPDSPVLPEEISAEDLGTLEAALLQERARLSDLERERDSIEAALNELRVRPAAAWSRRGQIESDVTVLEAALSVPDIAGRDPTVQDAERTRLRAKVREARAEASMLEQEMLSHKVRGQVMVARRNLMSRELRQARERLEELERRVVLERKHEAELAKSAAEVARSLATLKHPVVREIATENAELGRELETVVAAQEQTKARLRETVAVREDIARQAEFTKRRLALAGANAALGSLLLEKRDDLPELADYRQAAEWRASELDRIGLRQIQVAEEAQSLNDVSAAADRLMPAETTAYPSATGNEALAREIREALQAKRELLGKLDAAYTGRIRRLGELDHEQRSVVESAESFKAFVDQRLLWIPSTTPIGRDTLEQLGPALEYVTAGASWLPVWHTLRRDAGERPILAGAAAIVFVALLAGRRFLGRRLRALGERARHIHTDRFALTARAIAVSVALALPGALAAGYVGWRLELSGETPFELAVAAGLGVAAELWLVSQLFLVMTRPDGIAHRHFAWPFEFVRTLRRELRWFLILAVPITAVMVTMAVQPHQAHEQSLGRFLIIAFNLALAVLFHRLLRMRYEDGDRRIVATMWIARYRMLLYPGLVLTPLALAGLAAYGYNYTAGAITGNVYYSLLVLLGAALARDLALRWAALADRMVAMQRERERLETARSTRGEAGQEHVEPEEFLVSGVDAETVNRQTLRLLNVALVVGVVAALGVVWSEVFPALHVLESVTLWHGTALVGSEAAVVPITLADLLVTVLVAFFVFIIARNMAATLEILQLHRIPMDAGAHYALKTFAQYAVVLTGVILGFQNIGVDWGDIQWLVAAISVGLGFGLQEIFANFVSGLIILFERPMRLGDTVSVGNTLGTVTRFRIRATTITDWDNKETIVPNKTFITGDVTNWTLSEQVLRVVMRIGVGYGSDTDHAHRILLQTARANPRVLAEPEPQVLFLGVGESSLDFDIRLFVKDITDWLPLQHEYHMAVVKALRENGIEIPLPQRDLNLRSLSDLQGRQIFPPVSPHAAA